MNSMLYPKMTSTRRVVSMDGLWKFRFDEKSEGLKEGWTEGFRTEILMPVPSSFADFFTDKESREYTGDFWYETEFFVPGEWKDSNVAIRFGAATHKAVVFINGVQVGSHIGGFLPFGVNVNEQVKWNAMNKVVVLVNNELSYTTLPAGKVATLKSGRKISKPFFDFYNYSGLQRSVHLFVTPKQEITSFLVNHQLEGNDARVEYVTKTTGEDQVVVEVYDEDGNFVASSTGKEGCITIPAVRTWNVLDAYLYKFVVKIVDGDRVLDEYFEEIGVRTVEVSGTDILINGKPVYLKGFGKHEDSDIIGRGFSMAVMKRDFELMKWIGANSFRTAHYPYSEEIYQMADREGFLVIDEVAAVGFMESLMNFADAGTGKVTPWFDMETIPQLLENHLNDVRDLIERDHNHACVFSWSLLNEPETLSESATAYFEKVFEKAHECDLQKRPRTFAMFMASVPGKCKCYHLCDIIALNRYYGWYVAGGYEIENAEDIFRKEMDSWKELNLNVPFIFTEYGADTSVFEHKLPSVMWSQEYQNEYLEMCHRVFDSYEFVKGEQVWNFADFQTTEGIMRANGNKKGIFTRQRQPKDAAYYFKKRWESIPLNFKSVK